MKKVLFYLFFLMFLAVSCHPELCLTANTWPSRHSLGKQSFRASPFRLFTVLFHLRLGFCSVLEVIIQLLLL